MKNFTIKIHKEFESLDDYYNKVSSCHDIEKLKIRTLFINSKDDVLSPVECIDFKPFEENENVMMLLTDSGGHVCWFEGNINPSRWFIKKAVEYVEAIIENDLKKEIEGKKIN